MQPIEIPTDPRFYLGLVVLCVLFWWLFGGSNRDT